MTQLRHDSPVVYALYKGGFFSILGGLSMVMDSQEGEMTVGKKIGSKSSIILKILAFLSF